MAVSEEIEGVQGAKPIAVGEDIISAMKIASRDVQHFLVDYDGGLLAKILGAVPGDPVIAAQVQAQVTDGMFLQRLATLRNVLQMAISVGHRAGRDDLLKLLEDPLSSETRNTRRNVGALSVLALLVGFAGKAPESFLGFGIKTFSGWEFPALLALVIAYEFYAFTLYLRADLARRQIQHQRTESFLALLRAELKDFVGLKGPLMSVLAAKNDKIVAAAGNGDERDLGKTVAKVFGDLAKMWADDLAAFEREFRVQSSRRRWDEHVPAVLFAVSLAALLSTLRVLCHR